MGKADLHIHTRVSDGMASIERVLEFAERRTDLDVVAITDHEDVSGGLRARELAASRGYRLDVIAGAEVTTLQGHLIALFIESAPRSFRRVESALDMIHAEGGLALIPHPMSWLTRSISERTIDRLHARGETWFDAIELANPSPAGRLTGARAKRRNADWELAACGGSDAHHLSHVGSGWTEFEGTTGADLKLAIEQRRTSAATSHYATARELGYRQVALQLAWGYAATPRKMLAVRPKRMRPL